MPIVSSLPKKLTQAHCCNQLLQHGLYVSLNRSYARNISFQDISQQGLPKRAYLSKTLTTVTSKKGHCIISNQMYST
jgi:hypothetical protein